MHSSFSGILGLPCSEPIIRDIKYKVAEHITLVKTLHQGYQWQAW